ncbi:MAG: hypothetical protein U5L11_05415 [Arhodomonas sp.]|nr:hypothetical protein [Arhodomonas sp.]
MSEPAEETEPEASPGATGEAGEEGPSATPPAGEDVEPLTDFDFELEPDEGQTPCRGGRRVRRSGNRSGTDGRLCAAGVRRRLRTRRGGGRRGQRGAGYAGAGFPSPRPGGYHRRGATRISRDGHATPGGCHRRRRRMGRVRSRRRGGDQARSGPGLCRHGGSRRAHSLLEEVIEEGDDEQRRKAQNLRARGGSSANGAACIPPFASSCWW